MACSARSHRGFLAALISVVILSLPLLFTGFNKGWERILFRSPILNAIHAKNILRFGIHGMDIEKLYAVGDYPLQKRFNASLYNHPPLTSLACALYFRLFGIDVQSTRLVAITFSLTAIILLMILAQILFDDVTASVCAGLMCAMLPISFYNNREMDHLWIDISFFLAVYLFYILFARSGFREKRLKVMLFAAVILGSMNGWRVLIVSFLLAVYHAVTALSNKEERKRASVFIIQYILLLAGISAVLIIYIERLHRADFVDFALSSYRAAEQNPGGVTLPVLMLRYIKLHLTYFTPLVYASFFAGAVCLFRKKDLPVLTRPFMLFIAFSGPLSLLPWKYHAYHFFSSVHHSSFFVPVVLLSAFFISCASRYIMVRIRFPSWVASAVFMILISAFSYREYRGWNFRDFPGNGFEAEVRENTRPEERVASNTDLNGLEQGNIMDINFHNMFFMDRKVDVFVNQTEFEQVSGIYPYFVFLSGEGPDGGLFEYLMSTREFEQRGRYYLFGRRL